MAEPRRSDSSATAGDPAGRQGQIEALLVEGLDRYFSGRYEEAIHLWTRVLFLDRSHARARAYIDRARTALAEHLRRAEELLQASQQLIDKGDTETARSLLAEAVAQSGDDERASALRAKLERLERVHAHLAPPQPAQASVPAVLPGWRWPRHSRALAAVSVTALLGLLVALAINRSAVETLVGVSVSNESIGARNEPTALPVPSSSDVAMVRARNLYSRGRLAEALQALDRVDTDSSNRVEADALRVEIQRLLLASSRERPRAPQGGRQ